MVSSFPKMLKSSVSFSQSIRNRLRLKKLQAQAKNFCRVLDIRVAKIVETDLLDGLILDESIPFLAHGIGLVGSAVRFADDQVRVGKGRAHGQLVHVVLDSGLFQFR